MPKRDKPIKLDMSFEDAIRLFANPKPASASESGAGDAKRKGCQAEEPCNATADDPEAGTSDS